MKHLLLKGIRNKKLTKAEAGYASPPSNSTDSGYFSCGNCKYYKDSNELQSECKIVEGEITPHSCCNKFDRPNTVYAAGNPDPV